jgi:hypothetical protein
MQGKMNDEFFTQNTNELILDVSSEEPLEIFFGSKGCKMHKFNDVKIVPDSSFGDLPVEIIVTLTNYNCTPIILLTVEPVEIYQNPDPDPKRYPNFNIFIGNTVINKKQTFEGSIKIKGKCLVIQTKKMYYDG